MSNAARITTPGGSDNGKSPVFNSGTDAWDLTALLSTAAAASGYQPLDSDLTAIAALTTTSFGRSVLALADAAALRTLGGLGTIATQDANNVTITGGSVTGITDLAVADGGTGASTAANARTNLGLVIGTDVQAFDSDLSAIAALSTTAFGRALLALADAAALRTAAGLGTAAVINVYYQASAPASPVDNDFWYETDTGKYFVRTSSAWVEIGGGAATGDLISTNNLSDVASASTSRTNLGLGTIAVQAASSVTITGGSITGITDLAVADGGTGASTAANARTNLGLVIGTDVQAFDADLSALAAIAGVQGDVIYHNGTSWVRLAAGTSGRFLQTLGAGANPAWAAVGGGGDMLAANNLSDVVSAATARTNLGLAIGTNVQAYDAELAALAGLTSAADKGIQFTGSGTAATYDLTTAGKALLDDANAAAQLVTLGAQTAIGGLSLTDVGTPASDDKILLQDTSASNALKYAQFSTFGGGGSTDDPPSFMAYHADHSTVGGGYKTLNQGTANRALYFRVLRGNVAAATRIRLYVGTSAGNVDFGVYRSTATAASPASATRVQSTGSIACPGAGDAAVTITSCVIKYPTDWIASSADGTTATCLAGDHSLATNGSAIGTGFNYLEAAAFPLPSTAGTPTLDNWNALKIVFTTT